MKKLIAILMAFSMLFAFASCKDSAEEPEKTPEVVTDEAGEAVTDESGDAVTVMAEPTEETTESESTSETGETAAADETTTEGSTAGSASDPSKWSKEEIVEFYKNAAIKTNPKAKSTQTMSMSEMIVNNGDGALGFFVKMAKPIIVAVLEKNSTEFDGITGGFKDLAASDAKAVKAYKSGEYTVIEMTMKEQTDGAHGDMYSGTVGHAISVLGDVSVATAQFPDFNIDVDNADIVIGYTKPTVKVKINKNGIIEKGTWSYTVDVDIENLKIDSITVDTADATIDYVITVGGGF